MPVAVLPRSRPACLLPWLLLLALTACGGEQPGLTACEPAAGLEPLCGFHNPEDLAVLPGGGALLVSEYGDMSDPQPGSLARLDLGSGERRQLYGAGVAGEPRPGWGDAACPGPPPEFSPHGIHLSRRADGALQLLVVNHGGRESIELCEVSESGDAASWRGCALAPEDAYLNSVVATPEGGWLATHMFDRSAGALALVRGLLGADVGHVLEWSAAQGWRPVPGTDAPFPNGIELSPDGRTLYLDVYLGDEVRRIDRASGRTEAVAAVAKPDNIRWSEDGKRLLVASHTGSFREMLACQRITEGACPLGFEIVALDPDSLTRETLVSHRGAPMGAATVAVEAEGALYLGSFKGDRIVRLRRP